jgi:type IV secretion system protein VirD4
MTRHTHFIMDEYGAIGHLEQTTEALTIGRAFGLRMQIYLQSVGHEKKCFPDGEDQVLHSNTSQIYFAVNDYATAEEVSKRLGEWTQEVDSGGVSRSTSHNGSSNGVPTVSTSVSRTENWQLAARKLLRPEEIIALSPREAISLTPGVPPIHTRLLRYYEEKPVNKGLRLTLTMLVAVMSLVMWCSIAGFVAVAIERHSHVQQNARVFREVETQRR